MKASYFPSFFFKNDILHVQEYLPRKSFHFGDCPRIEKKDKLK